MKNWIKLALWEDKVKVFPVFFKKIEKKKSVLNGNFYLKPIVLNKLDFFMMHFNSFIHRQSTFLYFFFAYIWCITFWKKMSKPNNLIITSRYFVMKCSIFRDKGWKLKSRFLNTSYHRLYRSMRKILRNINTITIFFYVDIWSSKLDVIWSLNENLLLLRL